MTTASCPSDVSCADERPWQRTHVRAPRGDESFVAAPPLSDAPRLAQENLDLLDAQKRPVQGRTLAALRAWTRAAALQAARQYSRELLCERQGADDLADSPSVQPGAARPKVYVSGHQPALFHAGVWIKNFAVDRLARDEGAIGLNLVVDNDVLTSTSVRVPAGTREKPGVEYVPFDSARPSQPWEESRVVDRALFASFSERVERAMAGWKFRPLLSAFWPPAVAQADRNGSLVDCLTAARCHWERGWGALNLELPLSRLCRLDPFYWFASHLLAHLPRFHFIYNQVLREYREVYRLRSRTHPVSDLRARDGWLEAPFWVWRAGDRVRGRVYARQVARTVELSDGRHVFATLPLSPEQEACCAVEVFRRLDAEGLRFRTRALTTTLFARLCLADLFVHGLGGAKYDEMADRLIVRFFGIEAPGYLMLSGTAHLPLGAFPVDTEDEQRLRRQIRELSFHSDRLLPPIDEAPYAGLIGEKQRLIAEQQTARAARSKIRDGWSHEASAGYDRFLRLQAVNRQLAEYTAPQRKRLEYELFATQQQLAANEILQDRNFPACLLPSGKLKRLIDNVCAAAER